MYFFTLGPSEIRGNNRVMHPKGAIQQLLFAAFMAAAGKAVTVESLAEELWGTTPPEKMNNALQAQISRLRRMLARLEPGPVQRITATVSGYQFRLRSGELDAQVFLDSVEAIRTGAMADPRRCVSDLRRAITLWRGPAFGGVVGGPLCQTAASKYEEARISALELLYRIELNCGRHAPIIPELTETLAQNPVQEQFCRLLMLALYRSGRHIDALNIYRQFRYRLNEELGVDPSPMLRWYESAILEHDPALLEEPALTGQVSTRI